MAFRLAHIDKKILHPLLFCENFKFGFIHFQVILCGLIGIPPANGVIPQSPMHTKSLATLKHQVLKVILISSV